MSEKDFSFEGNAEQLNLWSYTLELADKRWWWDYDECLMPLTWYPLVRLVTLSLKDELSASRVNQTFSCVSFQFFNGIHMFSLKCLLNNSGIWGSSNCPVVCNGNYRSDMVFDRIFPKVSPRHFGFKPTDTNNRRSFLKTPQSPAKAGYDSNYHNFSAFSRGVARIMSNLNKN